jgi:hypothetical protein
MVDHLTLPVRGFEASRGFYLSALAPLGFGTVEEAEDEATFGAEAADDVFSIAAAGERPCGGVHLAFSAKDRGGGRLPPRPSGREDETTAPRVPGRTTGRATTPPSSSIPTGTTWRPSASVRPRLGARHASRRYVLGQVIRIGLITLLFIGVRGRGVLRSPDT